MSINLLNLSNSSGRYLIIIEYNSFIKCLSFFIYLICFLFITTDHLYHVVIISKIYCEENSLFFTDIFLNFLYLSK